jgi:hypothetical protein
MTAFIETYAPLAALLAPLLTLASLNLLLALAGERGTLLLPSGGVFGLRACRAPANVLPVARPRRQPRAPANDPDFRRAA